MSWLKKGNPMTKEAKHDKDWTIAMKKELNQFEKKQCLVISS